MHDACGIGKWPIAEPEPGKFDFYDEGVNAAHKAGLAIMGMLDGAPSYESVKPRATEGYWAVYNIPDKPNAITDWERYVRTVVGHYKGRIDSWEIWNEPWGDFFSGAGGTPELYARLMKTAYAAAKDVNPNAEIMGIDAYANFDKWTEGTLKAAGTQYFDAFSFHDYNDGLYGGPASQPYVSSSRFRSYLAKYGAVKPLWDTEGGMGDAGSWYAPETGGLAPRVQLAWIVRYDVAYMSVGVKRFFYYAMHLDPAMGDIGCRTNEQDRAIRPLLAAQAVLASMVDGAGAPKRSEPVHGVDLYTFPSQSGKIVSVAWSYDTSLHIVTLPRGARVLDVLGNPMMVRHNKVTVGVEPIYIVRSSLSLPQ
jgi:hypothetical protein